MELFDLSGDVAFVTGAGSGIGQQIALGLAEAGASVCCFDLPAARKGLEETADRIRAFGRAVRIAQGDATEESQLAEAIATTQAELGLLSVAVNAAGIANAAPAEEMGRDQWQRVLDVNTTGIFLSSQAEGRAMLDNGRGSIVNIASMSGVIVNRGLTQAHYNASKAAVIHLSKSLAMEWAGRGVRVNTISPGYTATPMNTRPEWAERVKTFENDTPMGRIAAPREMVGPAIFLSSRAASFCTGIDLLVDGGFCCW
ncbi:dehydrogenase [Swaminathania salitolerans LMG 21291]|uniref:Short chain dehydrogenase n=2 Tax=Swaminathania salitolerans TaxID=182838 RepID=A0A511BQ97_9PROT|nr:dehydrogenase [Swaminathania salitolerans LMG 21291]GEL02499.1 short chain dehydrogenase [Swaminathania salitolerans]